MLRVENLTVRYQAAEQNILNNVSFEIKKGEVVAIVGPSGCGKTTLLNSIQGLLKDDTFISGSIKISKNAKVRTVFQDSRLIPWRTVLKNVMLGLEAEGIDSAAAAKKAKKIIKLVQLGESDNLLPAQLSGGMKQRVNFARAIAVRPKLLLMDEPFSSLDDATKKQILSEFKLSLNMLGQTTIIVTHDLREAKELADRTILLKPNFLAITKNKEKAGFGNPPDLTHEEINW